MKFSTFPIRKESFSNHLGRVFGAMNRVFVKENYEENWMLGFSEENLTVFPDLKVLIAFLFPLTPSKPEIFPQQPRYGSYMRFLRNNSL